MLFEQGKQEMLQLILFGDPKQAQERIDRGKKWVKNTGGRLIQALGKVDDRSGIGANCISELIVDASLQMGTLQQYLDRIVEDASLCDNPAELAGKVVRTSISKTVDQE